MSVTNTPDVELVFGVDGHTEGGASYNLIAKQLQALSKRLAKNKIPLVKIGIDTAEYDKKIKLIKSQLKQLSTKISIPVDLRNIGKQKQNNPTSKEASKQTAEQNKNYKELLKTINEVVEARKKYNDAVLKGDSGENLSKLQSNWRAKRSDASIKAHTLASEGKISDAQYQSYTSDLNTKEQEQDYKQLNAQLEKCLLLEKDIIKTRNASGDKYASKIDDKTKALDSYNKLLQEVTLTEEQSETLNNKRNIGGAENNWLQTDEIVKYEGLFAKIVDKVRTLQNQIVGTTVKGADLKEQLDKLGQTEVKLTDENGNLLEETKQLENYKKAVEEVTTAYNKCKTEAAQYGLTIKTSWDRLQELLGSKVLDKIAQALVALGVRALNQVYQNVVKLDKALVNLQIATGYTREETKKLIKEYGELATQIGATVTEVTDAADTWLRQGYSVAETNELITATMMLSKLGQLDSAEAAKALTSAMKGYKLEVKDCINVVDKFTAVDMSAAINAGDIATALAETATSAGVAGVSMNTLIGYIATVGEVTQDGAESVGGFFKTLFARMGNIKTGVFTDDETGESLNDVEKTLGKLGISLRDSSGTFRDFDAVLSEVANNWDNYDNVQQHAIATAMAGTRQQEKFITLMSNYGSAMEYATVAAESSGTATKKYADYMDSIEAKLNNLTASWQTFSNNLLNSELVKSGVDFLNDIVKLLNEVLSFADGALIYIPLIAVGLASIYTLVIKIKTSAAFGNMITAMKGMLAIFPAIIKWLTAWIASLKAKKNATLLDVQATQAATAAQEALNATNPIGWIMLVVAGIYALIKAYNKFANTTKKRQSAYDSAIESYEESQQKLEEERELFDELSDSIEEYITLSEGIDDAAQFNSEQRQKALDVQKQIVEEVGKEAAGLDLVNGNIEENIKKLQELKKTQAKNELSDAVDNYYKAKGVTDTSYHKSQIELDGYDIMGKTMAKNTYDVMFERGRDASQYADAIYKYIVGEFGNSINNLFITFDSVIGDKFYGIKYTKNATAQGIVNDLNSILDFMLKNGYAKESADIYSQFAELRDAYQADIDSQNSALRELLTSATNSIGWNNYETIDSLDAYNTLRDKLIDAVSVEEHIADSLKNNILSNQDVATAVDNWLSGVYQDWYDTANTVAQAFYVASMSIKDILDEIEDEYDALSDALDEMKELGALSSSTIKSLVEDFPELWDYLEETGAILQDEDGYKLSEDALENYLDKIREEYDDALKSATEYKEALEKAGATEEEIAAAEKYIKNAEENIKNLEATINVLERSSLLEDYQEYLQNISDGLEDQKDKMKDIYDMRKDLLETYKDELDYQDELNKKQKSVADLQTKLALAKLDKSASGQAKVRELEQELADAQEELDEYTLDKAISDLTDMIDNEYDEYSQFIQTQVDALTKAIDESATKTAEELRKLLNGGEPTEHHSGGFVGAPTIKDNEEFAKLLNGELVVTSGQMSNFMKNTLPKISQVGGGDNNVVTYAAPLIELHCDNVTQDTLPQLEKMVDKAVKQVKQEIDESLTRKGYKKPTDKFTI